MIYPLTFEEKTGFNKIRELVKTFCHYEPGKEKIASLKFLNDFEAINLQISMVEEMRQIFLEGTDLRIEHYVDLSGMLNKAAIDGNWIEVEEVSDLRKALDSSRVLISFFKKDESKRFPGLKSLASDLKYFPILIEQINKILGRNNRIKDNASPSLNRIRKDIDVLQSQISTKLNRILKSAQNQGWIDEDVSLSIRNGRTVIPLSVTHKRKISGYIHDESATGKTVYIEPAEIVEANNELRDLENEERREIIRILKEFTNFIRPYLPELGAIHDFFAEFDSLIARARFALNINAIKPEVKAFPLIKWFNAIHPLLLLSFREAGKDNEIVPQDIRLNEKNRILIISGPNAGGKSVCLQTAGLLQYMLQCGFLVPVEEGSEFGIFENIFIDIGDEQSIESDLSTYSSHLINMKFFLKNSNPNTLILIDEFGSGTEPLLGGAIAEAVLEKLNNKGSFGIITTHYTNLKHFAASADGIINGAMLFDNHRMLPIFKLDIGRPGSSFAFEIAQKIGLPEDILLKARESAGRENIDFDRHLRDVLRDKKYWENKRKQIKASEKQLAELVQKYDNELQDTEKLKKKILTEAKQKAEELLASTNKQIENTIREIREAEAEKTRTKLAREKLAEFKKELSASEPDEKDLLKKKIEELKIHSKSPVVRKYVRPHKAENIEEGKKEIIPGSHVILKGTENAGEVIALSGKKCTVVFGSLKTTVNTEQLELISKGRYKQLSSSYKKVSSPVNYDIGLKKLHFKPEIDVRGKRGEEAMVMVTELIDEAVMVQARELRILHGKGNGILREMIRQYLKTINLVEWFGDEHPEAGGAGITIVKLEI